MVYPQCHHQDKPSLSPQWFIHRCFNPFALKAQYPFRAEGALIGSTREFFILDDIPVFVGRACNLWMLFVARMLRRIRMRLFFHNVSVFFLVINIHISNAIFSRIGWSYVPKNVGNRFSIVELTLGSRNIETMFEDLNLDFHNFKPGFRPEILVSGQIPTHHSIQNVHIMFPCDF